jgi:hypothetical protein
MRFIPEDAGIAEMAPGAILIRNLYELGFVVV